jgi:hypothetical protein
MFRVRVTLRLAVYHQSARLGAKILETHDQQFFFNWTLVIIVLLQHPHWWEDGSVIYNYCWPSRGHHSQVRVPWDSWPLMFRKYFSCLKSCWEWQETKWQWEGRLDREKLNKIPHFRGQSWNRNKDCGVCIAHKKPGGWKTAEFLSARCAQRNQDSTPSYASRGTILSKNIIWHTVLSDKLRVLITAPTKLFYMRLLYLYHYFPKERHNQKSHLWSVSYCKGLNKTNMVNAEISEVMGEPTIFNTRSWNLIKIYATLYEIWGFIMVVSRLQPSRLWQTMFGGWVLTF